MDTALEKSQARNQSRRRKLSATEAAGLGPSKPSSGNIAQIVRLLKNCDALIREGAVKSLARLGGKEAETAVLSCLDDPDPRVRAACLQGIGRLRIHEARDMLVRALDDREEQVQCAAAAGLGLLGDKRGIDIVLKFTHPKNPLKWEALRSLNLITRKRFPVTLEGLSRAVNYVKKHKKKLTKS